MIEHVQGMAGIARRNRGVPHCAKILVTRRKPAPAEMCAAHSMARKSAAMSAKVPTAAAEMMPAAAEAVAAAMTMAATVSPAMPASVATAPGDGIARQRQNERKNRNSNCAPEHGTLPAVTPPISRREC
jgi:hypothetical protein